jgi:Fatty acid desaturase
MSTSRSDTAQVALVRHRIQVANEALFRRHPWLRHQDAIGLALQSLALASIAGSAWLYLAGLMPAWLTILLVAFAASITHEIEHDLIHLLYFKQQPWMQDILMGLGWLARPSTANPWHRRHLHFHHHRYSGGRSDLEELAITNGEPWGLKRLLMTADMRLSVWLRPGTMRRAARAFVQITRQPRTPAELVRGAIGQSLAGLPLATAFWTLWHLFLVLHAGQALGLGWAEAPSAQRILSWLNPLTVCLIAPNVLRTFCLHFISSNMHYHGNVAENKPLQQVQVLNHPVFWPLQALCFNFGATHAAHHFVVGQPFYVRQWTAGAAHAALREVGIPFNDLGTFARANRRASDGPQAAAQSTRLQAR